MRSSKRLWIFVFLIFVMCRSFSRVLTVNSSEHFRLKRRVHHGWTSGNEQMEQKGRTMEGNDFTRDPVRVRLHPLDPLTEAEVNATSSIIRNFRRGNWTFHYMVLKEPDKSTLLPYFLSNSSPLPLSVPRKSFVVLSETHSNQAYDVVVNLDKRQVESWTAAPSNASPAFTLEEMLGAERVVREAASVVERCRQLGWTDMSLVNADPWWVGYVGDRNEYQGKRLMQMYLYGKNSEDDNMYAHPFDFLVVVDVKEYRVIAIEELPTHDDFDASNKQGNIIPRKAANYDPELRDPNSFRDDIRPVAVSQPHGASYTVTGNEIEWQKFKMRIGFNGREGLILYNLNYNDDGEVRSLFYRMSLTEVFTPYGDPRPSFHRKHVFDMGQYGIGVNANSLQPQLDCIGETHFFDAVVHNGRGEPVKIPRAVCLYEEDAGILWKHSDFRTGKSSGTRSQRLTLIFVATVGNYDYLFTWNFYLDGSIEFNVKLTGILSVHLLALNASTDNYGNVVYPQINAPIHQHFFSLRLDAEIDGNANSVVVSDVVPLSASTGSNQNPCGQGFTTQNTLLCTSGLARTNISPETSRTWHIKNPNSIHPYTKQPVSWKLMPWHSPSTHLRRDSPIHSQAEWLDYNTWVLPYNENQIYSAGFYVNNDSGLAEWVEQNKNANIDNTDIVIWHNIGITHILRVEDFPVMPVEAGGVMLSPMNFFKGNPALDVPSPSASRDEL